MTPMHWCPLLSSMVASAIISIIHPQVKFKHKRAELTVTCTNINLFPDSLLLKLYSIGLDTIYSIVVDFSPELVEVCGLGFSPV